MDKRDLEFLDKYAPEILHSTAFNEDSYAKHNVKRGLRNADGSGVVVGLTEIGDVHGYIVDEGETVPVEGRLRYRGLQVNDIVNGFQTDGRYGYEETAFLLLFGRLPLIQELHDFADMLSRKRELPESFTEDMILKAPSPDVMNNLARSVLAYYSYDPNPEDRSLKNIYLQCINLIALFLVPIVGIALGFDTINEERNSGTMSRLLSQPIYRDAVINGKFLAGIVTIAIMITSIVLLVAGMGLRMIGVPPNSEEIIRLLFFLVVTIFYGAFWLGLAILFSIFFRRVATSALAAIAVWLFFIFFVSMLSGIVANALVPVDQASSLQELVRNEEATRMVMRVSPVELYREAVVTLLVPGRTTMGQFTEFARIIGGRLPNPLPLGQSLLIVWPQLVSLLTLTVVCFAISYIKFMREEIRST